MHFRFECESCLNFASRKAHYLSIDKSEPLSAPRNMHKKLIRNNKLARESTKANCENVPLTLFFNSVRKALEMSRSVTK